MSAKRQLSGLGKRPAISPPDALLSADASLAAVLAGLEGLEVEGLRRQWRNHLGGEAAKPRNSRGISDLPSLCQSGVTGWQSDAQDAAMNLRDRIAEIQATTLAGLTFKAKYAASHYRGEYDVDVMTSIVDDLLAFDGEV
jgi:hypothetical protein